MTSTRNALRRLTLALPAIGAVLTLGAGTASASEWTTPPAPQALTAAGPTTVAATAAAVIPAVPPGPVVSRTNIVRIARSQLGYHERPNNCTKYGPCEEWCSLFATWVWRHAGVPIPKYAFTGYVYRWGQRHHLAYGRAALGRAQPGDVLLFGTGPSNPSTSTHIGIVVRVSGGRVTLIEGNSRDAVRTNSYTLSGHTFYGGVRP